MNDRDLQLRIWRCEQRFIWHPGLLCPQASANSTLSAEPSTLSLLLCNCDCPMIVKVGTGMCDNSRKDMNALIFYDVCCSIWHFARASMAFTIGTSLLPLQGVSPSLINVTTFYWNLVRNQLPSLGKEVMQEQGHLHLPPPVWPGLTIDIWGMAGNFGWLLKVLHLTEFTLAVEQVLAICVLAVMMSPEVLHNTFMELAIMIFIAEWLI